MRTRLAAAIAAALLIGAAPALQEGSGAGLGDVATSESNAAMDVAFAEGESDPERDEAYPARNRQLLIPSHGVGLNALLMLAAGKGPHPTMLLLHGLPGNEQNLDLAQAVRRHGWNVLTLHYRGSWGSPGSFSIANAVEDAGAAMAFLRSPEAEAKYGVDRHRLAIAGHSMGGMATALHAARAAPSEGRSLSGVLLIDAWNTGADAALLRRGGAAAMRGFEEAFDDLGNSLQGATAATLAREVRDSGNAWELNRLAPALGRHRIFILYAKHGLAESNAALAGAIARGCREPAANACGGRLWVRELDSDHSFADKRQMLARWVTMWLDQLNPDPSMMTAIGAPAGYAR